MARLALIGGGEFSEGFRDVHAELLAGIGGAARRVVYLPTCAADDGPEAIEYWCAAAREKLSALGAQVQTPPVIDLVSANDERHARLVAQADWIYLGAATRTWPCVSCWGRVCWTPCAPRWRAELWSLDRAKAPC